MPLYTYVCDAGHEFDRVAGITRTTVECECGADSQRRTVYRINVGGVAATPLNEFNYEREFREFREAGQELAYQHGRMEEAAGRELPTPPLAETAIKEARRLKSLGVKNSADWKARRGR